MMAVRAVVSTELKERAARYAAIFYERWRVMLRQLLVVSAVVLIGFGIVGWVAAQSGC